MTSIAPDAVDGKIIIGVDTHKYAHVAVALDHLGARVGDRCVPANREGYALYQTQGDSNARSWGACQSKIGYCLRINMGCGDNHLSQGGNRRMKSRLVFKMFLALLAVFSLVVAGCGNDDDDAPAAELAPAPAEEEAPMEEEAPAEEEAPMEPFRVAVVAPSASNDLAFTQSMVDAVNALLDAGHISEVAITDGTFIVEDAGAAIRGYAEEGYDLVIAHGSQYGGPLQEIAPDYPDVSFAWGTAVDTFGIPNVNSYSVRSDLGGYVNGTVAAQLTESDVLGVVGPIEVGDAKLYVDGFVAGATAQNPDVDVKVVYIGSFADVALAAETAQQHISAGADVLTGTAQMVVGATGVAQENGVLWFGTQSNQTALGEDIVVASQVYRWEVILAEVVDQVKSGTLGGTTFIMTFDGGGLEIQFNEAMDIPADVLASAQATIDGLSDGSISTGQ